MRHIEQVSEIAHFLNENHPNLEITPCELLELEEINWLITQRVGGGLADDEIVNDVGKIIGFVIGAALGLLFLPGLGFASSWIQGALIGGAVGYRLASLFSQPDAPADNQSVADPTARFSGTGSLAQLGAPIPMIYGNRTNNPEGGILRRDPIIIYSRIYTILGLQYIDRLAILSIGLLGDVNKPGLLLNDQPSNLFSSVDLLTEVSSGKYDQAALGIINHYSQAVNTSSNNLVGTVLVGSIRGYASGATRGTSYGMSNNVGMTAAGSVGAGYTAKKTANVDAWGAGFTGTTQALPATLGAYIFSQVKGTSDPTNPVLRWACGLSDSAVAATATLASMTVAVEINQLVWTVYQSGVAIASGTLVSSLEGKELEIRVWNSIPAKMASVFCDASEVWRGQITTPSLSLTPDVCVYTGLLTIGNLIQGTSLPATTAGDLSTGCGIRYTATAAFINKVQLGQIYRNKDRLEIIFVAKDLTNLWLESSTITSLLDFTYGSAIAAFAGVFNGDKIYSSNSFYYTTSRAVTSVDFQIQASVWARSSANAFVTHGQCFSVEMRVAGTTDKLAEVARFILVGDTEKVKSLSVSVTNLPLNIYTFNLDPLSPELIGGTMQSLAPTALASKVTSITFDGNVLSYIAEVDQVVTNANALLYMGSAGKTTFSSDRGASMQVTHVNEIINPFLPLQGSTAFIAGSGTGLKREYFIMGATGTPGTKQLPAAATDATGQVVSWDYNGVGVPPAVTSGKSRVFIDWSGTVVAKVSGVHTFYFANLDDGGRLSIDGTVIISSFIVGSGRTVSGTLPLIAGRQYAILVEYFNNGGAGSIYLEWAATGLAQEKIPLNQLLPGLPDNSATPADIICPTYPGYTIGRTREVASDRLQSVPSESWDIPLGAVCRQHLAAGTTVVSGTADEIVLLESVIWPGLITVGSTCRILNVGQRIITSVDAAVANKVTCAQIAGTSIATVAGSHIATLDSTAILNILPGMIITASNVPTGAYVRDVLPGNRVAMADEWGRLKLAAGTSTVTTGITYNTNMSKVANQRVVVFSMGSSNYFPDIYIDRLINPISGIGNYIDADNFIDYPSIVRAREFCIRQKLFFDAVIAEGSFEEWAIATSPSSLLFCTTIDGMYGLVIQQAENPSYLFNDSNVTKYSEPGIPWQQQLTNTVLVRYSDRLGREAQIKVQIAAAANGSEPEVPITISTLGVTRKAQAIKVGQVALKSLRLQGRTCQIETDVATGFYTTIGKIIRTQHREVEFVNESSGFILGIETTTNTRLLSSIPVVIDSIYDGLVTTVSPHGGTVDPANTTKILETISITSSPQAANNATFTPSQTTFVNEYSLLFAMTGGTPYSAGGTLTMQVPVVDQVIRLSDEPAIVASSRITITHRTSRRTEENLVITSLGSGRYQVIGNTEPFVVGDAYAIGISTTVYKRWRITAIEPDVKENTVRITCVAWDDSIMTPTGLVTVDTAPQFSLKTSTLSEVASVYSGSAATWTNTACTSTAMFKLDASYRATFVDAGSSMIALSTVKGLTDYTTDSFGIFKFGTTNYQTLISGALTVIPVFVPAAGDQVLLRRESTNELIAILSQDGGLKWRLLYNFGVITAAPLFCKIHINIGKLTEVDIY